MLFPPDLSEPPTEAELLAMFSLEAMRAKRMPGDWIRRDVMFTRYSTSQGWPREWNYQLRDLMRPIRRKGHTVDEVDFEWHIKKIDAHVRVCVGWGPPITAEEAVRIYERAKAWVRL